MPAEHEQQRRGTRDLCRHVDSVGPLVPAKGERATARCGRGFAAAAERRYDARRQPLLPDHGRRAIAAGYRMHSQRQDDLKCGYGLHIFRFFQLHSQILVARYASVTRMQGRRHWKLSVPEALVMVNSYRVKVPLENSR